MSVFENDAIYLKMRTPFTCILAGATGSGKTILVRRLLEQWTNTISIDNKNELLKVLWVYGQIQSYHNQPINNVNVEYSEYLPNIDEIKEKSPNLIILDDLMDEMGNSDKLSKIFTKASHHLNISVIFIVQNFFHQSKQIRTSLNAQYIILLKNIRDQNQIVFLGRQLFGKSAKKFVKIYQDATERPYGYLIIDLKIDTPKRYRLRTRMTKEELPIKTREKTRFAPILYNIIE